MKEFDSEHFRMKIGEDFLKEICVKTNQTFDVKDMEKSKALSTQFNPRAKYYVLLESEENGDLTSDARQLAASGEYSKYTAALALCSNKLYHRVMGNLFLKISRSNVPTRLFEKREDALEWLKLRMLADKKR